MAETKLIDRNIPIHCDDHDHYVGLFILNLNGEFEHPSRRMLDEIKFSSEFKISESNYIKNVMNGLVKLKECIEDNEYLYLEMQSQRPQGSNYVKIIPFIIIDAPSAEDVRRMRNIVFNLENAGKLIEVQIDRSFQEKFSFTSNHQLVLKPDTINSFSEEIKPHRFFEMNRYEFTLFEELFNHNPFKLDLIVEGTRCIGRDITNRRILKDRVNSLLHVGDYTRLVDFVKTGMVASAVILTRDVNLWNDSPFIEFTHTEYKQIGVNLYHDLMRHHDVRRFFLRNLFYVKVGGDWTYTREVTKVFESMRKWEPELIDVTLVKDLLDPEIYAEMDNSRVANDISNYLKDIFSMDFFNCTNNPSLPQAKRSSHDLSNPGFYVIDISALTSYQEYSLICYLFAMRIYGLLPHHIVTNNILLFHKNEDETILEKILDRHEPDGLLIATDMSPSKSLRNIFEMISIDYTQSYLLDEYEERISPNQTLVVVRDHLRSVIAEFRENLPDAIKWEKPAEIIREIELPISEDEEEELPEIENSSVVFANMAAVLSFMRDFRPYPREELILGLDLDDEFVDTALIHLKNKSFIESKNIPSKLGYDYISQFLEKLPQIESEDNLMVRLTKIKLELYTSDLVTVRSLYAEAVGIIKELTKKLPTNAYFHLAMGILAGSYQMEVDQPIARSALLKEFNALTANITNTMMKSNSLNFTVNDEEGEADDIDDDPSLLSNDAHKAIPTIESLSTPINEPKIRMVEAIVPHVNQQAPNAPPPTAKLPFSPKILSPEDLKPKSLKNLRSWFRFIESDYNRTIADIQISELDTFLLYFLFQTVSIENDQIIKIKSDILENSISEIDIFSPQLLRNHLMRSKFFLTYGDIITFPNFNDLFVSPPIKIDALYSRYNLNKISMLLDEQPDLILESDAILSIIIRDSNTKVLNQVAAFCFMLLKSKDSTKFKSYIPYIATLIKYSVSRQIGIAVLHPSLCIEGISEEDQNFIDRFQKHYTPISVQTHRQKINPISLVQDKSEGQVQEVVETQRSGKASKKIKEEKLVTPVFNEDLFALDAVLQQELVEAIESSENSPDQMLFYVFTKISHSITGVQITNQEVWMDLLKIFNEVGAETNVLTTGFTRQFHDLMQLWDEEEIKEPLRNAYRRVLREAIAKFRYSHDFSKTLKNRIFTLKIDNHVTE